MAKIAPFRALRFDPAQCGDLNLIVTQPYDKIGKDLQAEYYKRSPFNVSRIIKSDEVNQDPETPYPVAAKTFRDWIEQGLLKTDSLPAIYIYYQTFRFQSREYTRKGFVASVELEDKGVRAHENTLAGPKADRLRLLRALECSDELTFMLFSDSAHSAAKQMDEDIAGRPPLIEVKDDFGETHRLWAVTDSLAIKPLQTLLAERELLIADGHHRYETAINFKKECEAKGWKPVGVQGFDHRMMALFPMEDPGLVIFPTHRMIKNVPDFSGKNLLLALDKHFKISPTQSQAELLMGMETHAGSKVLGMRAAGTPAEYYLLELKDPEAMAKFGPKGLSAASQQLDVAILHSLILENILGIDAAKLAAGNNVEYGRSAEKALSRVGQDGIQATFLLNATTVKQVKEVAEAGERMPQKSTDFYPKLLAGLVMMKLEIEK
jgi:uncharacterized protein (DUF1015 family)